MSDEPEVPNAEEISSDLKSIQTIMQDVLAKLRGVLPKNVGMVIIMSDMDASMAVGGNLQGDSAKYLVGLAAQSLGCELEPASPSDSG